VSDTPLNLYASITDDDRDRSNVLIRAGYMWGIANSDRPLSAEDREMLARTSKSLRAYAELLDKEAPADAAGEDA